MRTIGVVTTCRSDYGIYLPILKQIQTHPPLELQLYVTGMHLKAQFGHTVDLIERDGFPITAKVDMLLSDSPCDIATAMGKGTMGFAEIFKERRPDILLVLGDRFEMHAAAVAAIPFGIPIAHIHGGELTYGSFDDYFRHSLTKFSHLHFASTEVYANRIRQMGEEPWRVIVSGAPGLDHILAAPRYSREELGNRFKIDCSRPVLLVTFHPVTKECERTKKYIHNLLEALTSYENYRIVFTAPNADTHGQVIADAMAKFVKEHQNAFWVANFGPEGYVSIMAHAEAMVGNSSSGIIEAASFELPVVNIGTRQNGRIQTKNVINVGCRTQDIREGIEKAVSTEFVQSIAGIANPYGDGRASERIVGVLAEVELERLKGKEFCDLPNS